MFLVVWLRLRVFCSFAVLLCGGLVCAFVDFVVCYGILFVFVLFTPVGVDFVYVLLLQVVFALVWLVCVLIWCCFRFWLVVLPSFCGFVFVFLVFCMFWVCLGLGVLF